MDPQKELLASRRTLLAAPVPKRPTHYALSNADFDRLCMEAGPADVAYIRSGTLLICGMKVVASADIPEGSLPAPVFD